MAAPLPEPVLALCFGFGRLLRWTALALWWVLRALWALTWRLAVLAVALFVVAFHRPLAWRLAGIVLGAALSGRIVRLGGMGGERRSGGQRTVSLPGGNPGPAPVVKLRPVSAQRVATASYAETRFFTRGLDGPGLLSMCVGPAGVGKSEIVWGSLRAGQDGEDFCGLKTTRPKRVLLLSEMGGETLQPALRRWGFYAEPAGRLDAVRLRLLPPRGGAGGLIDVLYATDVYRPQLVDGELRVTEWPAVIAALVPLVEKGRYDKVVVDSLGEWLGADNNDSMLKTLSACRQLAHPLVQPRPPHGSPSPRRVVHCIAASVRGTGCRPVERRARRGCGSAGAAGRPPPPLPDAGPRAGWRPGGPLPSVPPGGARPPLSARPPVRAYR